MLESTARPSPNGCGGTDCTVAGGPIAITCTDESIQDELLAGVAVDASSSFVAAAKLDALLIGDAAEMLVDATAAHCQTL